MKKIIITLAFTLFFQFSYSDKHALIIAIGDYPEDSGWSDISSANDIPIISRALMNQGFPEKNIVIIQDEHATYAKIKKALEDLYSKVKVGDIVVIHYSGHGQQITDAVDIDEIDGLDEALVSYDAKARYSDEYKGENHFRDDELGRFVTQFRNKLKYNGQLLMLFDSCHSGTATRGSKIRGTSEVFRMPNATIENEDNSKNVKIEIFESNPQDLQSDASPFVLISGASADEYNYEFKGYGSLSYAFSSAISDIDVSKTKLTYLQLFSNIESIMNTIAKRQTPAIEGNLDFEIFGGDEITQQPYFKVNSFDNPKLLYMQGGKIQGLFNNTKVIITKKGVLKPSKENIVTTGIITHAKYNEATVELETSLPNLKEKDYWIFIEDRAYNDVQLDVFIDKSVESELAKEIEEYILSNNLGSIPISAQSSDLIVYEDNGISIATNDDYEIFSAAKNRGSSSLEEIKTVLFSYAQGQFLKDLQMDNEDFKFTIRYIPVEYDKNDRKVRGDLDFKDFKSDKDVFTVRPDVDYVQLEVTNLSNQPFYFNILEINSKGELNPILDICRYQPEEMKIEPGDTKRLCTFNFGPPFEKLTLKGFASDYPLDFSGLVKSRGELSASQKNPLNEFLSNTYQQSRGPKSVEDRPDIDGYTTEFIYEIVKD